MNKNIRYIVAIALLPFLVGCNEKKTHSYYMRHPKVLEKDLTECQTYSEKSSEQIAQCQTVKYAAANMMSLINELQANQEKFGQRIINAEANYVKLKATVAQAKHTLDELKYKQVSAAEIRAAQDDLYKAKNACEEQRQEIKELLAVLGMNSPG